MNKIYNCDFFDLDLPPNLFDLVILDLPYGQTDHKWDTKVDLNKLWDFLINCCKKDCIYIFFTTVKFGDELIDSRPKNWFKYDLVWEKSKTLGFLNSNKMPLRKHEMIYIFSNNKYKTVYNPIMTKGEPYVTKRETIDKGLYGKINENTTINKGTRYPTSILKFNNEYRTIHGTQKPLELVEWLIKTYSNKGDNVLDPTMGSGTTILACIRNGRNFVGIEKDKKIFNDAKKRLNSINLL